LQANDSFWPFSEVFGSLESDVRKAANPGTGRSAPIYERLVAADTVEKLGSVSDAKILEEFCLILRATCSLG
jgi:hypothetical protein